MPKPVWLIESRGNHPTGVPQRLMYTVQEMGMEVIPGSYVPFRQDLDLSFLPTDRPVIFYGSVGTVRCFSRLASPAVRPFAWFDHEALSCRGYYARWGSFLLQEDYAFYPFAEILRLHERLYERHGEEGRLFIRPDANDKSFTGEVVEIGQLDAWHGLHTDAGIELHQLCVVARPVPILAEYRLVIWDRKLVAASLYRAEGETTMEEGCPAEVRSFAERVVGSTAWQPVPIFCLDVALTPAGPRVVEVGEINCSDLYRCDLRAVATAMAAVAEREWQPVG